MCMDINRSLFNCFESGMLFVIDFSAISAVNPEELNLLSGFLCGSGATVAISKGFYDSYNVAVKSGNEKQIAMATMANNMLVSLDKNGCLMNMSNITYSGDIISKLHKNPKVCFVYSKYSEFATNVLSVKDTLACKSIIIDDFGRMNICLNSGEVSAFFYPKQNKTVNKNNKTNSIVALSVFFAIIISVAVYLFISPQGDYDDYYTGEPDTEISESDLSEDCYDEVLDIRYSEVYDYDSDYSLETAENKYVNEYSDSIYGECVDNAVECIYELCRTIKVDSPMEIYEVFDRLLRSGALAKNSKKFEMTDPDDEKYENNLFFTVLNGENGCCRNLSDGFFRVLRRSGFDVYPVSCDITQKNYSETSNHELIIVKTESGKVYLIDPLNNIILENKNQSNKFEDVLGDCDDYMFIHPEHSLYGAGYFGTYLTRKQIDEVNGWLDGDCNGEIDVNYIVCEVQSADNKMYENQDAINEFKNNMNERVFALIKE